MHTASRRRRKTKPETGIMNRTRILRLAIAALAVACFARPIPADEHGAGPRLQLVAGTVAGLHQAMKTGLLTPEQLVRLYRARNDAYDKAGPRVNAFLFVNPNAE